MKHVTCSHIHSTALALVVQRGMLQHVRSRACVVQGGYQGSNHESVAAFRRLPRPATLVVHMSLNHGDKMLG